MLIFKLGIARMNVARQRQFGTFRLESGLVRPRPGGHKCPF
jgi:hypothetical protein